MPTVHFNQTTTLSPEEFVAGLTDFGSGREKVFSMSADDYLKVHQVGPADADVKEGSGGVWDRLHYDWDLANSVHRSRTASTRSVKAASTT